MNHQLFFPACACSALLCASFQTSAADQRFDPRLEVGGLYDSNLRLVYPPLDDKVNGGYVDAAAIWSAQTPLTDFSLQPRVRATDYTGSGESGTTNAYLSGNLAHKLRRSRLGLAVDLSKQEVLTADLVLANGGDELGTPGTDTAGLAFNNNKVFFATVRPTGNFGLGARTQLLVDTRYSHANYDSALVQTLNDYTDVAGSVGLSYQATQRLRWVTNLTADRFAPETGAPDADSLGANVELWREQSQLTRAFVRLGAMRTQFSASGSPTETNFIGGLGIQRKFTNGQVFLQANRRVDPSGFGQAVVRDELNLRLNRNLSERVLVSASAVGIWSKPVAASSTLSKRRYYVASLDGAWRVRRTASIVARLQYASRYNESLAGTPNSTAAYAGVVYEPHRRN